MKKRFILPLVLLLILAPITYAATQPDISTTIYNSLGWLTKINLAGPGDQSAFWAKIVIFILIFTLVFWLLGKIGDAGTSSEMKNQIKVPIAIVFGLTTVLVPNALLQNLIRTYQVIIYFLLFGAASLLFLIPQNIFNEDKRKEHPVLYHAMTAMIAVMVAYVLTELWNSLKILIPENQLDGWLSFMIVFSFIYAIYHIIRAVTEGVGAVRSDANNGAAGGAGAGNAGGGAAGPGPASYVGPNPIKYGKPTVVPQISLCTENQANGMGKIRVNFIVSDQELQNQRIDNYEVKILPSRFAYTPGHGSTWRNLVGGKLVPFLRTYEYTADRLPFTIPEDLPQGGEWGIEVRAHNSAGWGPKSNKTRIVMGRNVCGQLGVVTVLPLPPVGTIKGEVYENIGRSITHPTGKNKLPGATVTIDNKQSISNNGGDYVVNGITPGHHHIDATLLGYTIDPSSKGPITINGGTLTNHDILMNKLGGPKPSGPQPITPPIPPGMPELTARELVAEIIRLNPGAVFNYDEPNRKLESSIPGDKIILPAPFYYNDKNGITNKGKTGRKYISLKVTKLKQPKPSKPKKGTKRKATARTKSGQVLGAGIIAKGSKTAIAKAGSLVGKIRGITSVTKIK